MRLRILGTALVVLLATTCAPGGGVGGPDRSGGPYGPITRSVLAQMGSGSVWDAVERARPHWLRPRGVDRTSGPVDPVVILNGQERFELADLRTLSLEGVREIRFVPPRDATTRWGTGFAGGVILVVQEGR